MKNKMSLYAFFIALLMPMSLFALEIPKSGEFKIKDIPVMNILYANHDDSKGHISNSVVKLVQCYLLKGSDSYDVVFPQFSISKKGVNTSYYAIAFTGSADESNEIKIKELQGGLFASYVYRGSYMKLGQIIPDVFQRVLKTGKYVPHNSEEVRLLYWNSIDDNHPENLITEIQVRIKEL